MEIAVLGAGSFGTALVKILETKGRSVHLWTYQESTAQKMNEARSSLYLPEVSFGPSVKITHNLVECLSEKDMVFNATPFQACREIIGKAKPFLKPNVILVNGSKGLERDTHHMAFQIFKDILPSEISRRAVFISGPNFAKELVQKLPAAMVAASRDIAAATRVQEELETSFFRIFPSEDIVGVCLAGAIKNVYAIAAGISDGLGFGLNARAGLIARSLEEMSELGCEMGGSINTFLGPAGIGDLILTCTGDLSRNRRVGLEIGKGKSLDTVLKSMKEVAEGVPTTKAVELIQKERKVEMPIAHIVYQILFEGLEIRQAVNQLLTTKLFGEI